MPTCRCIVGAVPDFAADTGRHRKRLSMLSVMPHTTISPFQWLNPGAITTTGHADNGATYDTSHGLLLAALRDALLDMVGPAHDLHGIGRMGFGACAGLYALLTAHPVDGRGRCWSCRGPGWLGRRHACMVYRKGNYWLRQPTHLLQAHLASELGVDVPSAPGTTDPDATEVLPRVADGPTH